MRLFAKKLFVVLVVSFLSLGVFAVNAFAEGPILCGTDSDGHLQGFDSDGQYIYWSLYSKIAKTDMNGNVVAEQPVKPHHGDCCVHDGKIYDAASIYSPNGKQRRITVYRCSDLAPVTEYEIQFDSSDAGTDGIFFQDGFFYVGEGKDPKSEQDYNWIHVFTPDFKWVRKIKIPGKTIYGVQTITFAHGSFWLGTYSGDRTYQCDENLNVIAHQKKVDTSVGAFGLPAGPNGEPRLMVARNVKKENGRWTASCSSAILKNGELVWE